MINDRAAAVLSYYASKEEEIRFSICQTVKKWENTDSVNVSMNAAGG